MMAKASVSKAEIFVAINEYIAKRYGLTAKDTTIHISNGMITDASFKFDVKEVGR